MPEPHPWFQPLHRRVLTMVVCLILLGIELYAQDPLWLAIAVGINAYAVWHFFLSDDYKPDDGER